MRLTVIIFQIQPKNVGRNQVRAITSENSLKIPDFSGFTTRARPGMKLQAIFCTEMMVTVVV
jgi:hypothetical protein